MDQLLMMEPNPDASPDVKTPGAQDSAPASPEMETDPATVSPKGDAQATAGFTPPSVEELQATIPHLEIVAFLKQGGMGSIYKARQTNLNRIVALKVIPAARDTQSHSNQQDRFLREAQTLARLSHSNIVPIFDVGHTDRFIYFVMEFVEGDNLRNLMQRRAFSIESVLKIISQICGALEYAHTKGITHRDIKPENILINREGIVKIVDFGLAKIHTAEKQDRNLTGTRQIMGTPNYMSPEQIECTREVDHRSDIYSLGVVFYELLTGELPIGHFSPPSALMGHHQTVDAVVLRALHKNPEQRYQRASELSTDLGAIPKSGQDSRIVGAPSQAHAEGNTVRVVTPPPSEKPNATTFFEHLLRKENWIRLIVAFGLLFSQQWFIDSSGFLPCIGSVVLGRLAAGIYGKLWPQHLQHPRYIIAASWILGSLLLDRSWWWKMGISSIALIWLSKKPAQKYPVEL